MTLSQGEIRTVIVGCLIALFLSALDQTIIATALPAIAADLGDFALISWVVTSYLLAATCATPILGKLSDLYGRRPVLLLCLFIFLAGSVLCAAAPSMGLLIAARALQGLGGGGLITLAQATVADIVSPRERARYSAYFATTWGLASVLGPTLGGVITEFLDWTWIFWINLPMGAVALLVADRALRKLPPRTSRGRIDLGSMALFATSALAFLLALSFGGRTFPWISLPTAGLVAVSLATGALFWRRQRGAAEPIMPPRFLKDPVLAPLFLSMFLVFGSFIAISTLVPVYLKITLQLSASSVGLLMIGLMLSSTLSAGWAGQHLKRTGRYTLPPRMMLPVTAVGLAGLAGIAGLRAEMSPALAAILLALVGVGIGPMFPVSIVSAQNAVERHDIGTVTGTMSFVRGFAGAVGTTAASALVIGLMAAWVPSTGALTELEDIVRQDLSAPERIEAARAFGVLFAAVCAVILAGLVAFTRVADRPLSDRPVAGPPGAG